MGNKQSLSQPEIQELCIETSFTPKELKRIYKRFVKLDNFNRGYVTIHDLASIPDVDKNPIGERICRVMSYQYSQKQESGSSQPDKNTIDFKEFVRALASFNQRDSKANNEEAKLKFLFKVYDVDSDGLISKEELLAVLKNLVANKLTDTQLTQIVERTIKDLDSDGDGKLKYEEFRKVFGQIEI